jgi:CheY-like chemotaxis protein
VGGDRTRSAGPRAEVARSAWGGAGSGGQTTAEQAARLPPAGFSRPRPADAASVRSPASRARSACARWTPVHDPLQFDRLRAELSARFINLPAAQVDGAITDALRSIVELLGVDRSQLIRCIGGIEFSHALAEAGRDLPTIFITALQPTEVSEALAALAPVAVLNKPFNKKELLDAIGRVRNQRRCAKDAPARPRRQPLI